jgi:hypothetical protein
VYGQGVYAVFLAAYLVLYVLGFTALGMLTEDAPETFFSNIAGILSLAINVADGLAVIAATVLWGVMIWRAAPNTSWKGWTLLARTFVLVAAACVVCALLDSLEVLLWL